MRPRSCGAADGHRRGDPQAAGEVSRAGGPLLLRGPASPRGCAAHRLPGGDDREPIVASPRAATIPPGPPRPGDDTRGARGDLDAVEGPGRDRPAGRVDIAGRRPIRARLGRRIRRRGDLGGRSRIPAFFMASRRSRRAGPGRLRRHPRRHLDGLTRRHARPAARGPGRPTRQGTRPDTATPGGSPRRRDGAERPEASGSRRTAPPASSRPPHSRTRWPGSPSTAGSTTGRKTCRDTRSGIGFPRPRLTGQSPTATRWTRAATSWRATTAKPASSTWPW